MVRAVAGFYIKYAEGVTLSDVVSNADVLFLRRNVRVFASSRRGSHFGVPPKKQKGAAHSALSLTISLGTSTTSDTARCFSKLSAYFKNPSGGTLPMGRIFVNKLIWKTPDVPLRLL